LPWGGESIVILRDRSIREEIACGRSIIDALGGGCIEPSSVDLSLSAEAERLYGSAELGSKYQGRTEPAASGGDQDFEPKRGVRQKAD
jgi:deoxycytidine triphosphate deaminase